jgi:inorganic triphosphatase YgiF
MSSDRAPIETEIKLRAPPDAIEALERHPALVGAAAEERREVTTYFDTPKLDLARRHRSLRIRQSGGRRIQTAKAAHGDGVAAQRSEWERPIEADTPDLSLLADTPIGAALHGSERIATGLRHRYPPHCPFASGRWGNRRGGRARPRNDLCGGTQ